MAFTSQFLEELKARLSVPDIVGRRVRLTRKGKEHQGLCPFHNEKTPSFYVYDDHYHCFGCGAHGSGVDFVMETEGLSFPEAVERLAHEVGMEIPVDTPEERERAKRRQTLHEVMETACKYFERSLRMPEGRAALEYLNGRGLDDAAIARFRLGFAPDGRGLLKAAMAREGADEAQIEAAGLIKRPDDGRAPYEYFRGRVMFPITDRRGRVIAFGGRILGDGEPKYLNSPETELFRKSRVLYGLAHAMGPARKAGRVVVAEGYMDVIALALAGIENAVAPLGTALTEDQIAELWRLVPEPILCFDGDAAGQRAAARAAERALPGLRSGLRLRFAMLPEGDDPDTMIRRGGAEAMERVLDAAQPLSQVLWTMEAPSGMPSAPEDKADLFKRLKSHAQRIEDPDLRGSFLDAMRARIWPPRDRNAPQRKQDPMASAVMTGREHANRERVDKTLRREQILLAVLVAHPDLFDEVGERLGSLAFSAPELDNLRQEVLKTLAGEVGLDSAGLQHHLRECGFSEAVDALLSPNVYSHAFFARADAPLDTAREGWEETYAFHVMDDLRNEVHNARDRLAGDTSDRNVDGLRALLREQWDRASDEDAPSAGG